MCASHYLPNLELSDTRGRDNAGMTAITSPEPAGEVGVSYCLQISRLLSIQSEVIFSRKQNDLVLQKARIFLERTWSPRSLPPCHAMILAKLPCYYVLPNAEP